MNAATTLASLAPDATVTLQQSNYRRAETWTVISVTPERDEFIAASAMTEYNAPRRQTFRLCARHDGFQVKHDRGTDFFRVVPDALALPPAE